MEANHVWKFFRVGGVDQVLIERGSDIENLKHLDLKLWIAVAMPVKGVDIDPKTAVFLDHDSDGRIRAPDILAAIEWLSKRLASLDALIPGRSTVELSAITSDALRKTAERIVSELPDEAAKATSISVADIDAADKKFTASRFNGDGVITEKTPETDELRAVVKEIMETFGSVQDRSETPGIDETKTKEFFTDVDALHAWRGARAETCVEKPLGDATDTAAALLRKLKPKLDDYFTRCRLIAFDDRTAAAGHSSDADLVALGGKNLAVGSPELLKMPLARIAPNQPLPFEDTTNPAFAADLIALRHDVAKPLLGGSSNTLTETEYRTLISKFASYDAWWNKKPATKLDGLSVERVATLSTSSARKDLLALIARDADKKGELDAIMEVEKLLYLYRDLARVLRNFVSFIDFYRRRGAMFKAGTLYLDGRACELCIEVADVAKHSLLATFASTYLAYCECRRKGEPNRTIVAAFTAGDSDNLMVGRNGVFVDRDGNDWDATITKTVENPISIRQAFFSPYKKFVRMIEEQVAKRASDADAASQAQVGAAAEATANADRAAATPPAAPTAATPRRTIDIGTVAAIGVAVGGIGALATGLVSAFFGLGMFMPLGLLAMVLLISGPSMLLAFLKLHRRNLGPLLDASGWAVNGLAYVNVPFGGALTSVAALPKNSSRTLEDPYAEKKSPVRLYALIALVVFAFLVWTTGKADRFLPRRVRAAHVLHVTPAAPPAEAPTP